MQKMAYQILALHPIILIAISVNKKSNFVLSGYRNLKFGLLDLGRKVKEDLGVKKPFSPSLSFLRWCSKVLSCKN